MESDVRSKRRQTAWSSLLLAAYIGLVATDFEMNRPALYAADPATGRVCRAPTLERHPPRLSYYTTAGGCRLAWSFAGLIAAAALVLLSDL